MQTSQGLEQGVSCWGQSGEVISLLKASGNFAFHVGGGLVEFLAVQDLPWLGESLDPLTLDIAGFSTAIVTWVIVKAACLN